MKVDFNRAALQEVLALVTSIVPSRSPKPILLCLRIMADEDQVRICATDLEVGITCQVTQVQVSRAGDIVVPADRLSAVVRESVDEVISLEASESTCRIRGADSHFTIFTQDPSQYPQVPQFDGEADFTVSLDALQDGVGGTLFAVARESTRYAINGSLWEVAGKKLSLVATDGRRLAKCKVGLASVAKKESSPSRWIVPARTMALLARLNSGEKETLSVKFANNQVVVQSGGVVIGSNLVEGNFPKYEDIIPTDYDKKVTLKTEAMLSAVRRASLLTNEESKGIRMAISKDSAVFSGRAPETGDAQVDMSLDYKGEPIEMGFNPQFLIDMLRVIKSEEVQLELGQPDRPGLIKSGSDSLYVIMPINLS